MDMEMKNKSLKELMLEAGVNELDIDNHASDLYVKVTNESKSVIEKYEFKANVTTFKEQTTGELWYDIPFAYI